MTNNNGKATTPSAISPTTSSGPRGEECECVPFQVVNPTVSLDHPTHLEVLLRPSLVTFMSFLSSFFELDWF